MLMGMNVTTGMLVEAYCHPSENLDLEQLANRSGRVVTLPTLSDRITLHVGQLFIDIGEQLKAASLKHSRLSGNMA